MQQYNFQHPIYANNPKDIPERLKIHRWLPPVEFNKLPKRQLKVKMCCPKCEEKVLEEIWEVPGVFDVRTYRSERKVVVTAMPWPVGLDEYEVLRKARKIDCKARFVDLDPERQPDPKPSKPDSKPSKPDSKPSKPDAEPSKPDPKPSKPDPKTPKPGPNLGTIAVEPIPPKFPFDPTYPNFPPLAYPILPPEYHLPPPLVRNRRDIYQPLSQDSNMPFYFFLFIVLLISMFIFR